MKLICLLLLMLAISDTGFSQSECRCRKATVDDETIWGHAPNEYTEEKPLRIIKGKVQDGFGFPIEAALIEVFADNGVRTPTSTTQKRIAACKIGADGSFCFTGLKAGKYKLAVGAKGFNISFVSITLKPKSRTSSSKALDIILQPGT